MTVKVTGINQNLRLFQEIEDFLGSTKPMKKIVEDIKGTIEEKTAQGKDYKNRNFKPYSPEYRKRTGKTRVDLKKSGRMLESMKIEVLSPTKGSVFIQPKNYPKGRAKTDMIAQIHTTGTGKQPRREFFNISKTKAQQIVKKHYDDEILKILRKHR